jgi:hypothetical protein
VVYGLPPGFPSSTTTTASQRYAPSPLDAERYYDTTTSSDSLLGLEATGLPRHTRDDATVHDLGGRETRQLIGLDIGGGRPVTFARPGRGGSLPATLVGPHFEHYGIVGQTAAIAEVIQRIKLVSTTRSTVVITGETGTGKELVARAIHDRSAPAGQTLRQDQNCAAIPDTLLESELFGHVRGAFTDATTTKKGKFSLANHGSIFLDEIGTMSVGRQAKLLRVLQEREIEPLERCPTISPSTRSLNRTTPRREMVHIKEAPLSSIRIAL